MLVYDTDIFVVCMFVFVAMGEKLGCEAYKHGVCEKLSQVAQQQKRQDIPTATHFFHK